MSHLKDKVDFLGIGAAKSGTSWIAEVLRSHPQVYLPERKELRYFNEISYENPDTRNPNYDMPVSWYLRNFSSAEPGQLIGEVTPTYLWNASAPIRIKEHNSDVFLFAILRDPVSALESQCVYRIQRGVVRPAPLDDVLRRQPFLVDRHRYGRHLARYLDHFSRDQICVLFYDDLLQSPEAVASRLLEFLQVDVVLPSNVADPVNVSGRPQYPRLNRFFERTRSAARTRRLEPLIRALRAVGVDRVVQRFRDRTIPFEEDRPALSSSLRLALRQALLPDVELLESLVDRDLSHWK